MAEYIVGGQLGIIIVLEGRERRGLKMLADELGKVVAILSPLLARSMACVRSAIPGFWVPLRQAPWERNCFWAIAVKGCNPFQW